MPRAVRNIPVSADLIKNNTDSIMKLSEQVFRNVKIYDECIISSLTVLKNMLKIPCK